MKEIKFRGKTSSGRWLYGDFRHGCSDESPSGYITEDHRYVMVRAKTVGQFTGLKDKNGVKIYEGDVIKFSWLRGFTIVESLHVVRFCKDEAAFKFWDGQSWCPFWGFSSDDMEVVGNIFDDLEFEKRFGEIYRSKE